MNPETMPAIFFGHGSPMNALESNRYTQCWVDLGARWPQPKAILMVSAHWCTQGLALTAMPKPRTIHDFGGFPPALYAMQYAAPGDPKLAREIAEALAPLPVVLDESWGFDHGTWSVLCHAYPKATVPIIQLSLNYEIASVNMPQFHFELGQRLAYLRQQGVMICGSGNIVHNLRRMNPASTGETWAHQFNQTMRETMLSGSFDRCVAYQELGVDASLAVPTMEHFLPLLVVLGARLPNDQLEIPIDGIELGTISMMSVLLHCGL